MYYIYNIYYKLLKTESQRGIFTHLLILRAVASMEVASSNSGALGGWGGEGGNEAK